MKCSQRFNIIIPTCNGVEHISGTIAKVLDYFSGECKIIIVENGSSEDQKRALGLIVASYSDKFDIDLLHSEKGFGNALRAATQNLTHEFMWITADDLPFGFSHFESLNFPLDKEVVVIASKAHPKSEVSRRGSRKTFSYIFRGLRGVILGLRIGDTQGDFVMSTKLAHKYICMTTEKGFLFTTQLSFLLCQANIEVIEVPVVLNDLKSGSRVKARDLVDMFIGTFRIRWSALYTTRGHRRSNK